MKSVRIIATLALSGALAAGVATAAQAATAGGEKPAGQERAVVVLPGAGQLPTAVWLPVPHRAATGARPAAPAPGDHFTKASARTPVSGLSGGSLASLTAGALTAAAASLLIATRRLRSRRW